MLWLLVNVINPLFLVPTHLLPDSNSKVVIPGIAGHKHREVPLCRIWHQSVPARAWQEMDSAANWAEACMMQKPDQGPRTLEISPRPSADLGPPNAISRRVSRPRPDGIATLGNGDLAVELELR